MAPDDVGRARSRRCSEAHCCGYSTHPRGDGSVPVRITWCALSTCLPAATGGTALWHCTSPTLHGLLRQHGAEHCMVF